MLTQVIGDVVPTAIAVAISPFPVVAVVLMLGTPKARVNGPMFAVGWVVGLVAVVALVLTVAGSAADPESAASEGIAWGKTAGGIALLVLAARQWRKRPRGGGEEPMPAWMEKVDTIEPSRALVLGLLLSAVNPKNLLLTLAGAATIARAGLSAEDELVAGAVFVAVGSITVVGAVVAYLVATEPASRALAVVKDFMARHNTAIMVTLLVLIGAKMLGEGLGLIST